MTVLAGTLPTPVRVVATEVSSSLSTQSSGLSISSGFPDQGQHVARAGGVQYCRLER